MLAASITCQVESCDHVAVLEVLQSIVLLRNASSNNKKNKERRKVERDRRAEKRDRYYFCMTELCVQCNVLHKHAFLSSTKLGRTFEGSFGS